MHNHPRVAVIHHWFIRRGGAERVVEQIAAEFPEAEVFTLVAKPEAIAPALRGRVHTSYLQHWLGSRRWHRLFMPLFPMALESFDLSKFDLVISSESGPSKGVLTRAGSCHICYCHSPMRYIWEMPSEYRATAPGGALGRSIFSISSHYVRLWDYATAARVDEFVASCANVARRIHKTYRRTSEIIYPPVDLDRFSIAAQNERGDFYLVLSRLVAYKRIDLAIKACGILGRRLVIIGDGEERRQLGRLAGPDVEFRGGLSDTEAARYLRRCRALLFPGEEDMGLVPVEAQACGRPVIAFGRGGALETVIPLDSATRPQVATGVFFYQASPEALAQAILTFEAAEQAWSPGFIQSNAMRFGAARFRAQFRELVEAKLRSGRDLARGTSAG